MDSMRLFDAIDRVQHRHGENDWHPMQPEDPSGGPEDPERSWRDGQVFRCKSCDEWIKIVPRADQSGVIR